MQPKRMGTVLPYNESHSNLTGITKKLCASNSIEFFTSRQQTGVSYFQLNSDTVQNSFYANPDGKC